MPIINAILEEFNKQSYHHLLHCFPDVSLVEPVAGIEEIQRVLF